MNRRPTIEIPTPSEDRPAWIKVGIIALLGFVIGVAWPRLAGVRLGPVAPPDVASAAAPAASSPVGHAEPSAASAPPTPSAPQVQAAVPPPAVSAAAPTVDIPQVTVNRGIVLSCKTDDGDVKKGFAACGSIGFDALAQPRLKKLAACPAALGATGKLSVVFNIDFPTNRVAVEIGKSSTVANLDGFAACIKPAFQGVSVGALDHEAPHYALLYSLAFAPRNATAGASTPSGAVPVAQGASGTAPAGADTDDGTAQVVWEVAIVRDTPRTGQVLARLQRGTKIHLGQGQEGWYRVKYGTDFSNEGWVYRGAIGR
jgi:hypothetical protein